MLASADLLAVMRWRCCPQRTLMISVLCMLLLGLPATSAEEESPTGADPAASEASGDAATEPEEEDETKKLLSQMTIVMGAEVIDAQTFAVRDTAKAGKKVMRLGNTALLKQASNVDNDQFADKVAAGKEALEKAVGKQMIWHKAAPDEHQPPADGDTNVVVVDAWSIDGRHINSLMRDEGHLEHKNEYTSELAKDILSAAAEKSKQESYKELEKALKESQKYEKEERKKARAKAAKEEEEAEPAEPLGFAGWFGLAVLGIIVVGALTNFGRASNKKVNLNRKRGPLERFWMKLKGA